ncbi:MAG: hypothetical protein OXH15_12220 [Gammaproteobacteria bacterium]|nr:hypothetical protein [Gammaproteobacteria bacterium]
MTSASTDLRTARRPAAWRGRSRPTDRPSAAAGAYVIARFALAATMRSRLFVAFLVACIVPSLVLLIAVYLRYNVAAIEEAETAISTVLDLDAWLFETALEIAQAVTFLVVLVVGPALVAPDLANNAMPLYLSRPVPRRAYVVGKLLVLLGLCVAVGLGPGLLLIVVNAGYGGEVDWLGAARLASAFTASLLAWTVCLSMLALAISAWVKWRPAATLGLLSAYIVTTTLDDVLQSALGGRTASFLDLADAVQAISATLAGVGEPAMPATLAGMVVAGLAALATWALALRL